MDVREREGKRERERESAEERASAEERESSESESERVQKRERERERSEGEKVEFFPPRFLDFAKIIFPPLAAFLLRALPLSISASIHPLQLYNKSSKTSSDTLRAP